MSDKLDEKGEGHAKGQTKGATLNTHFKRKQNVNFR